jgi:radical SAM superfamily enzyme YgiQ (UPF0313 family)
VARAGRSFDPREQARERLAAERGTIRKDAPDRVALLDPSPYRTAMSSLGFQTIYREINGRAGRVAERAFLPDDVEAHRASRVPLFTYESERPVADAGVVAMSVAYENELSGVIEALDLAGLGPLAEERTARAPLVLGGGPLTFSNPLPMGPFFDAVLLGEADETIGDALDAIFGARDKTDALAALARDVPSCWIPSLHGERLPALGVCDDARLPAYAQITTPHTELRDMFLVETERGCSRGCTYCVMRRSTNGGMRIVPMDVVLSRIPADAARVGLVGAAVSDHPKIVDIVDRLASEGRGVGLSSLRPDKLSDRFCAALRRAGYKTLTTASDGASQRLRDQVQRRAQEKHLLAAAERARAHGFDRLKLYMMLGLPGETDADVDELAAFATELSKRAPLALGIAPFVAKRNTPLDGEPFAGIDVVERRLARLRRATKGRVDVRATSARWAWVEYVLAQGSFAEGRAVYDAVRAGGGFAAWKRAFEALPAARPRRALSIVA